MRPSLGGDALPLPTARPRSRKSSVADHSTLPSAPSSHVPTTFFLRSEGEMEQSQAGSRTTEPASRQRDSTYGVQSLADTLDSAFGQRGAEGDSMAEPDRAQSSKGKASRRASNQSSSSPPSRQPESSKSSPLRKHKRIHSSHTLSAPPTPLPMDLPSPTAPSAIPSTPKSVSIQSLKLSDEESGLDEVASQVITSSGDEDEEETQQGASGTFPQLVMPSLQMPSRRPFTAKGKAMGKLKVLVAGESGIGKTSLIRAILQLCEDIVHVDSLSTSQSQSLPQLSTSPSPKSRGSKTESSAASKITEVHASTKTYPHWWAHVEDSRRSRRRKSSSDSILERNICFIDTPGYGKRSPNADITDLVADYVESLLYQNASIASMEDADLVGLFGGTGGVQVDVILYLLPPGHDISKDVDYMQRLSALTNVIPIIAKSDTLSPAELLSVKTSILARLQTTSVKPFFFGKPVDDALLALQGLSADPTSSPSPAEGKDHKEYPFHVPTYPYAISTAPGPDSDTMDASLLMSPDYVQPLLPSELPTLVSEVFNPDSIAWLRHAAARKFLAWRHLTKLRGDSLMLHGLPQHRRQRGSISSSSVGLTGAAMNASGTSSIFSAASPSGVLVPRPSSPFYMSNPNFASNLQSPFPASSPSLSHTRLDGLEGPPDFSLARYNAYAQGEQRLAEVRLAKWATDLQRSIRNERERFEELQRTERARWLLERVGEEVRDGNIVTSPTVSPRADWAVVRHGNGKETGGANHRYVRAGRMDSRDPLGLCDLSDEVKRRGFGLVKVLGGMSVIGAVVVAVAKVCGVEPAFPEGGLWSWITGAGSE